MNATGLMHLSMQKSTTVKYTVKQLASTMIGIDTMDKRELEVKLILIQAKLDLLADKFKEIEQRGNYVYSELKAVKEALDRVKELSE